MKIAGPMRLPALLKNKIADFRLYFFQSLAGGYYALEKGEVQGADSPLVRVHSACNIAHIFHSQRCDCQAQLDLSMELMHREGTGLLIYLLHHEGRAVGPFDHIRVYQKQDEGLDTVDSYVALGLPIDKRNYDEVKIILDWFKVRKLRLLTNNPAKVDALTSLGFEVKREPLIARLSPHNQSQIKAKVEKLGHLIPYRGEANG